MPFAPIQQKIDIEEIKDGIIYLKNGGMRAILLTSSINFALKSSDEQDALIFKYQSLLNSLDFPLQISVISRRIDLSSYLAVLEQKKREQPNELLKIQIDEYMDFIKNLVQISNIISQSFLVVIPLSPMENKEQNIMEKIGLTKKKSDFQEKTREELKDQIWQRADFVISGLAGIGIKAAPLNDQEIIEILYKIYNTGSQEKLKMEEIN
ncbi:MAG: hypothetical protein UV40_C0025G0005 [Parcubacteria group bacterium GW2011_GWA1_42_7]|nr:MAG: hypothetical protein UV34_C0007G0010 [Parcubacteria group bacterium GW2011_GWB1_42_6]KKS69367.1 MAG: hypothetical protein UV40_C0025G0005 [Parcubacteria group bacterium GW2011_GWA1_42_7]KKS92113.1 MAG: hypothetical protein UV67_C0010G0018 [Parcubacteria group bacterium GW2011_GWC1_43_12]